MNLLRGVVLAPTGLGLIGRLVVGLILGLIVAAVRGRHRLEHRVLTGGVRRHLGHRHGRRHLLGLTALLAALAAPARPRLGRASVARGVVDRIAVQHDAAAPTVRTRGGERLDQPGAQALTRQLHQTQRGHLGHLVAGAVTGQRLGQPPQHQIAVRLEHHVDEVDDDDAADVAQPQLAHDLFGRLEVVAGDSLLEVAARPGELSGVDVDDGHRLGAVDDQRATRRQPHLAVHGLGELLVDTMHGEHVRTLAVGVAGRFVLGQARHQVGRHGLDIGVDGVPRLVTRDDQPGEVLVEQVADHLDEHVWLFVERDGGTGLLSSDLGGLGLDLCPALLQTVHVGADVVFLHALRCGADDHAGVGGHHFAQDLLEPLPLGVGQLSADPG